MFSIPKTVRPEPSPGFNVASTASTVVAMKHAGKEAEFFKRQVRKFVGREKPLFKDEIMPKIIDPATLERVTKMGHQPVTTAIRERYFRKALSRLIKSSEPITQVIILGSGYDTLPARKEKYTRQKGINFYEVDQAEVLGRKADKYQAQGIYPNAQYVAVDYVKENLIERLKENGVDFDSPTHIIWEGNIMYLEAEDAERVLSLLKENFKHFTISFDYVHMAFLENTTGNTEVEAAFERFQKAGLSWITGVKSLAELAQKFGLIIIDDKTSAELAKEYEVDEDPVATMQYYSVCTLRS
ncbi:MAG: SAM-dependent methyltransferase [Gammaproteobacteria bacterium]|jgi:methyltransferase (TIGR00027 family)|nr:SAM-dependent methyltransferase [Gammaproteobacteria bacterium]MCE3239437.1 SAM-dependent methyltransferase [Gammaproteobacteria bacterium]